MTTARVMDLYVVGRAQGKTTFTLETMYREPDWLLIVGFEAERGRVADILTRKCLTDGPPPWWGDRPQYTHLWEWRDWWLGHSTATPATFQRQGRGRGTKVAIDNLDMVLQMMFGDVQMATATGINTHHRIPTLPRIKCADCGGPYDEDNDALGLCAECLAQDENWGSA